MTSFLHKLGLEQCVQAVVHNGFYTSMEALRGATYEELIDSGVRPGHAKLILGHLNSSAVITPFSSSDNLTTTSNSGEAGEVAAFLRSVGLEACQLALEEAGYSSVEALGRATLKELVGVGIKPVHARLIVSNLDSASALNSVGVTPAGQNRPSFDDEALLGGGVRKHQRPVRMYALTAVCALLIFGGIFFGRSSPQPHAGGGSGRSGRGSHGARVNAVAKWSSTGMSNPATTVSSSASTSGGAENLGGDRSGILAGGALPGAPQLSAPNPQHVDQGAAKATHHKGKGKSKGGGDLVVAGSASGT